MKKKIFVIAISILVIGIAVGGLGIFFSHKSENEFEATYQEFSDEDVMYEDGELFVDSQILITAAENTSKRKIQRLVKSYGGEIVGYLSVSNDYQISFPDKKTLEELNSIIEEIQQNDFIEEVSLHKVMDTSSQSAVFPDDPWINADKPKDTSGSEWSLEKSEGNNWWAEAIMMPYVWGMDDANFSTVKVGIIDTMFDTDNEDLDEGVFAQVWGNPTDEVGNCTVTDLYREAMENNENNRKKIDSKYYHGTHVAGLIAAEAGNGFGIAGVSQNSQLYGCGVKTDKNFEGLFGWKYALTLMFHEGVKVVNISMTLNEELFVAAQKGVASAKSDLESYADSFERFLRKYIKKGYDFLIVKAAGNLNGDDWISCEVSEEHLYGYRKADYYSGEKMTDSAKALADSTKYDAQYDVLGAIDNEEVKNHILIVGAAENHKTYYEISDFSVIGDRVDIYAPGTSILSDMPDNITASTYGTSMSTPIVTGIASLIWGMNPELTSEQVHDIIISSANWIGYKEGLLKKGIPVVNAYVAVLLAQNTIADENEESTQCGTLFGLIYSSKKDENENFKTIDDTVISIYTEEGKLTKKIASTTSGIKNGKFQEYYDYFVVLPAGTYTVIAEADGYVSQSASVDLYESEVTEQSFVMDPTKTTIKVVDAVTGKIISDAQCTINQSNRSGDAIRQNTDENGKLELELNSGTYQITIRKEGYKNVEQEFQVNAHENTDIGEISMEYNMVTYSGRVYSGDTGNAKDTVTNVTLKFTNQNSGKEYSANTQDDGSFSVEIPVGEYKISLSHSVYKTKTFEESITEKISDKEISIFMKDKYSSLTQHEWYNEAESSDNWSTRYGLTFGKDGSIQLAGYRNKDSGTYEIQNDGTILAKFTENYYDVPAYGYQALEYSYTVTITVDDSKLYCDFDETFEKECNSNAYDGWWYIGESTSEVTVNVSSSDNQQIELKSYLSDFNAFYDVVGGSYSSETGSHAFWIISDGIQYGAYENDTNTVDEISLDTDKFSLYSVYIGQDYNNAKNALLESGWEFEDSSDEYDWMRFTNGDLNYSFHWSDETNGVTSIGFYKEHLAW